jgi:hypothetical protein
MFLEHIVVCIPSIRHGPRREQKRGAQQGYVAHTDSNILKKN